jgi:hypothetical protein
MRRFLTLVALAGVPVMVLAGCRASTSDTPPGPALEMTCDTPQATRLGVPTVRKPARFTTSGGRLRFVVKALPSGSILGEIDDTEVQLAAAESRSDVRYRVTASRQQPGVVDVDAGTYSVLNSNRGEIEVEVCPDVTLSDVEASQPDPQGESTTGSGTSTPSSDEGIPGTSPSVS